jgi:4-hydroxybenzoate polyprenyltransferase
MSKAYSTLERVWIYQKERFPLFRFGAMAFAFSFCGVCISRLMRAQIDWPDPASAGVAFICVFLFFLQLRFLDEFKDYEVDKKFRPERPVPRGLISLVEVGWALAFTVILQAFLVFWLNPSLLFILLAVWLYMALMTVEFFVSDWLKPRLLTYMWTHMLLMPIVDLFATGCDWMSFSYFPPSGLLVFLVVSFFNGLVVELGRKTWAPSQERVGVDSYSGYCGLDKALWLFRRILLAAYICILIVGYQVGFFIPVFALMTGLLIAVLNITVKFARFPEEAFAKKLEDFSGIWVIFSYLMLGAVPLGYVIWFK